MSKVGVIQVEDPPMSVLGGLVPAMLEGRAFGGSSEGASPDGTGQWIPPYMNVYSLGGTAQGIVFHAGHYNSPPPGSGGGLPVNTATIQYGGALNPDVLTEGGGGGASPDLSGWGACAASVGNLVGAGFIYQGPLGIAKKSEQNPVASYTTTILCLANSRKTSGRCIAGKSFANGTIGNWIRPVSGRPTGELSGADRRFQDGKDPSVLDIVSITMSAKGQHPYQPENHVIDDDYYWAFGRRATAAELQAEIDNTTAPLWGAPSSSSYSGINDRVEVGEAPQFGYSLRLISVSDLRIRVSVEGVSFGSTKRNVRGQFTYNGSTYFLMITDPIVERVYFARENGTYDVGHAILCVSLGDVYSGYAYKLVAAVISPQT